MINTTAIFTATIFIDKQGELSARYFTSSAPYEVFSFFGRWPEATEDLGFKAGILSNLITEMKA